MSFSTLRTLVLATPFVGELVELAGQVLPMVAAIGRLIGAFRATAPTPAGTCQFEKRAWFNIPQFWVTVRTLSALARRSDLGRFI